MDKNRLAKTLLLFVIGISAGTITLLSPRLMTFLTVGTNTISITLFPPAFLIALCIFSLFVGIAMVFLYLDSNESLKNLFMAALALPAILSGGLSMSNTATVGQMELQKQISENVSLKNKIQELAQIPIGNTISFDDFEEPEVGMNQSGSVQLYSSTANKRVHKIMGGLFAVSDVFAQSNDETDSDSGQDDAVAGIKFNIPKESINYIIILKESTDLVQIQNEKMKLQNDVQYLKIKKAKNKYYLIQYDKKGKTAAMLEAAKIKRKFTTLSPRVVETK